MVQILIAEEMKIVDLIVEMKENEHGLLPERQNLRQVKWLQRPNRDAGDTFAADLWY